MKDPTSIPSSHRFRVLYNVQVPETPLEKSRIPEDWGATDAIVILSVIRNPEDVEHFSVISWDGEANRPVSVDDLFRYWLAMSTTIAEVLPDGDHLKNAFQIIAKAVEEASSGDTPPTDVN